GSNPGISVPLSTVLEYRSPKPRTRTCFPSTMDTPVTLLMADPASPSPALENSSLDTPSMKLGDFRFMVNNADWVLDIWVVVTTISVRVWEAELIFGLMI